jgi:Xaa-Pro aminopeptidase
MAGRRQKVVERLEGVDALVVTSLPNVRYLSGFTGSNGVLVLSRGSATLFTDPRYTLQAGTESDCRVVVAKGALLRNAAKLIARRRWRKLGFERSRMSFSGWAELQDALGSGVRLLPLSDVVEAERMVKSQAEVELIRESVLTNSRAFERTLKRLKPGSTENEVAAEIEFQMRRLGAEGVAFESIVAAGPRSALPHARPTAEPIGANRLLLFDVGALQSGYCSDMTRVVHLGNAGSRARKLYRAVLEAQLAAIDAVRPGATTGSVDKAARTVLRKHGLEKAFVHSTGHGLGLEIHEAPRIGRKDETRLQAGMAITIEPGAYIEGFGGVRIEDTVVVTPAGCEVLTPTPKELQVV